MESYTEHQLKQNKSKKNYNPTAGLNHAPKTQQASYDAARQDGSKAGTLDGGGAPGTWPTFLTYTLS